MFIIVAPCVIDLGLEVEAFREMMRNSSLGCRVRVGQVCRDRESRISVILLMVDLSRVVVPDAVLELGKATYACGWMRVCLEFRDKILFKEGRM